jgi:hypothetical protein
MNTFYVQKIRPLPLHWIQGRGESGLLSKRFQPLGGGIVTRKFKFVKKNDTPVLVESG